MFLAGFRRVRVLTTFEPLQRFPIFLNRNNHLPTNQVVRAFGKGAMKTNKSAAKRFRVKGNGDLKRQRAGKGHNTGYMTRGRVNRLSTSTEVKGKKIVKMIKRVLRAP